MNTLEQIDYLREQLGIRDSQVLNDLLNSYSNAQISLQNQLVKLQQKIDRAVEILKLCNSKCAKETIDILRGKDDES